MKKAIFLDVATSRSLKSEVDLFSKFQVNFLEKYMRCILADHFNKLVVNIYEEFYFSKPNNKISKLVGGAFFQVRTQFTLRQLLEGLTVYFKQKSQVVSSGEFPHPVKFVYGNQHSDSTALKEGDLVFVDVKIRVEVARIEEIPGHIQSQLSKYFSQTLKADETKLQQCLLNHKTEFLNILVFYYGDIHFDFDRPQFKLQTLTMGGKEFKVRMLVVFVSKIAMFETFRTTNNIKVECINDLVISFYQIKREKRLANRQKKREVKASSQVSHQNPKPAESFNLKVLLGAGGAICVGFLLMKMFS